MADLITLDEVKSYLGISDSANDALITLYIPVVSDVVREVTNNPLVDGVSVGYKPTIARMVWFDITRGRSTQAASTQAIKSKSVGPVSITYADHEINRQYDYPQAMIEKLETLTIPRFS